MTPVELIDLARRDGAHLALTPNGRLRVTGGDEAVARWLPIVGQYAEPLTAALLVASGRMPTCARQAA